MFFYSSNNTYQLINIIFFFISIFILFNIMNYYIFIMKINNDNNIKMKKKIKIFYWKW